MSNCDGSIGQSTMAVCRAYGWDDLVRTGLDHGFHAVGRDIRYTVGPVIRREIIDRLLELNHTDTPKRLLPACTTRRSGAPRKRGPTEALF